eukprot:g38483.t1
MIRNSTSSMTILNSIIPQGCVLRFLLYSLCTHDCVAKFRPNSICKFADDITVVGQISNNDETERRKEIECLVAWCKDNNLSLNVSKMKELVIDFRTQGGGYTPIYINGAEVEMVGSVKFLGMTIANNLSWSIVIDAIVKKRNNACTSSGEEATSGAMDTIDEVGGCTGESVPDMKGLLWALNGDEGGGVGAVTRDGDGEVQEVEGVIGDGL